MIKISINEHVVGVAVTYNPDPEVFNNLREMVRECGQLIVVDNGSLPEVCATIAVIDGVELLAMGANLGIATALNRGLTRASELGAKWVVTFDQDSRPEPGMVRELLATAQRMPLAKVVGPRILEAAIDADYRWLRRHPHYFFWFQRIPCVSDDLNDVTMAITSGALTSIDYWREVCGFEDKLFIDFVDTDFCLRLRAVGGRIAVSSRARLVHHLGHREARRLLGRVFFPTHHEPIRHYYIARNRVLMIGRHGWRHPHWLMFEFAAVLMWTFRVMVFERRRDKKIFGMVLGTWAGLRHQFGACPREVFERLQS